MDTPPPSRQISDERRAEYYAGVRPEEMSDIQAFLEMIGSPQNLGVLVRLMREALIQGRGEVVLICGHGYIQAVEITRFHSLDAKK